jgi:hypothetical protein
MTRGCGSPVSLLDRRHESSCPAAPSTTTGLGADGRTQTLAAHRDVDVTVVTESELIADTFTQSLTGRCMRNGNRGVVAFRVHPRHPRGSPASEPSSGRASEVTEAMR